MTPQEKKSNEIAAEYLMGHDRLEVTYEEMREAVMTMAEWKDQQFKEYLEKKLESIRNCYRESKLEYQRDYYFTQMIATVEIFNELFKEEEIDNEDRED